MACTKCKRILASMCFLLLIICLWITKWGLEFVLDTPFPLNTLLPILSVSIFTSLNILLISKIPQKPETPRPSLKTVADIIVTFGVIVNHVYAYRSIVYLFISYSIQIYTILLLLISWPTKFYVLDLFVPLFSPVVQFAVVNRILWLSLGSAVILGPVLYLRNYYKELDDDDDDDDDDDVAELGKYETTVVVHVETSAVGESETVVTVTDVHVIPQSISNAVEG